MKKKSGHRRRTKVVRRSRKNLRRTFKRKSLGKSRRRPTRRYSRVQRGGMKVKKFLEITKNEVEAQFDEDEAAEAFDKLGDSYFEKHGHQQYKLAIKFYKLATERGNSDAAMSLGNIYRNGIYQFMDANENEANKWYQLAYSLGNQDAKKYIQKVKNPNDMTPP